MVSSLDTNSSRPIADSNPASRIHRVLIPQRLPRLERVFDAFQCLGFAAEAQENFALQVQDVLLGDKMKRSQIAAAENVGELRADLLIVFADLAGRSHLMQ